MWKIVGGLEVSVLYNNWSLNRAMHGNAINNFSNIKKKNKKNKKFQYHGINYIPNQ